VASALSPTSPPEQVFSKDRFRDMSSLLCAIKTNDKSTSQVRVLIYRKSLTNNISLRHKNFNNPTLYIENGFKELFLEEIFFLDRSTLRWVQHDDKILPEWPNYIE
jgi:hypothetical protein